MIRHAPPRRRAPRPALTLAESVVCLAIVSTMLVAALSAVAAARKTENRLADRARAHLLAVALLEEVLRQPYEEPGGGSFGREIGEAASPRSAYDDVDDYHNYAESPPKDADGAARAALTGWTRSVEVAWVDPANLATVRGFETGVKRIRVVVTRDDLPLATVTGLRTRGWPDLVPKVGS